MLYMDFCAGQTDRHVFSCNYDPILPQDYYGFVPNEVFFSQKPLHVCVYAVVQFLSFFKIKCSTRNIVKNLNSSEGSVRNALYSLCMQSLLIKSPDGTYKFKNHKLDCSMDVIDASELPSLHYGYWFPLNILKERKINNSDKKMYTLFRSITKSKKKCIDVIFLAKKLSKSRSSVSKSINRLLDLGYLKRDRNSNNSAYFYEVMGGKKLEDKSSEKEQCNQNKTSNCHQNATPIYSSSYRNKYIRDMGTEERGSCTYNSASKNDSLYFLEEVTTSASRYVENFEISNQDYKEYVEKLNDDYTKACAEHDIEGIQRLRAELSRSEMMGNENDSRRNKAKGILEDYNYCVQHYLSIQISEQQHSAIGKYIKDVMPDSISPYKKRKAFNILMNSVIMDLNMAFYDCLKSFDWREKNRVALATQKAIDMCLSRLNKPNYRLNSKIEQIIKCKMSTKDNVKSYKNEWHWLN